MPCTLIPQRHTSSIPPGIDPGALSGVRETVRAVNKHRVIEDAKVKIGQKMRLVVDVSVDEEEIGGE